MGSLIKEMSKHVTISDPDISGFFEQALAARNFLMHHFFLERDEKLRTKEGRLELLSELLRIQRQLNNARTAINAMRLALCEKLGIDSEFPHLLRQKD
jgi:hypothetical protein